MSKLVDNGRGPDVSMDATTMYREDVFTDQRVGTIRRMSPVTASGEPDPSRPVLFQGQAQVLTPAGAIPINFELSRRQAFRWFYARRMYDLT